MNDLRKNCFLVLRSSFVYHWKGKFRCFIQNFYVARVWQHQFVRRLWPLETLHIHCKSLMFFRCLLNETTIYFKSNTHIKIKSCRLFSDSRQVTQQTSFFPLLCGYICKVYYKCIISTKYFLSHYPLIYNKWMKWLHRPSMLADRPNLVSVL